MQKTTATLATLSVIGLLTAGLAAQESNWSHWGIEFANSGATEAQQPFIRGITALHLHMFEDAEAHFQQAQRVDPDFAMAYWGEAMAHNQPIWRIQRRDQAQAILERLGSTPTERAAKAPTTREKDYLATLEILYGTGDKRARDVAYEQAMRQLSERYPGDTEALAFWTLSRVVLFPRTRVGMQQRMRTAALAQEILTRNPHHPGGARYLIQATDDPIHAELGLIAAEMLVDAQPQSSTARHLPGHVFIQLGRWAEAAKQHMTAFDASMQWTAAHGYTLQELNDHNYVHLLNYGQYCHLQLGQLEKARDIIDLTRRDYRRSDQSPTIGHALAITSARYLIETADWEMTAELAVTAKRDQFDDHPGLHLALGLGAGWTGQVELARASLAWLARFDTTRGAIMRHQVAALIRRAEGDLEGTLQLLAEAVNLEDATIAFTHLGVNAYLMKPSHELYGEVLLSGKQPSEALDLFEAALIRYPGRTASLLGAARSSAAVGNRDLARRYYSAVQENFLNADPKHPIAQELLAFLSK
jgi:tetratricopeptide (TPR) repeat protein